MATTLDNPRLRVLIDEPTLRERIAELGRQIAADYEGKRPVLVCILKGSMPFFCELAKAIDAPVRFDYLAVESYHGSTKSSGVVKFTADVSRPVEGEHVILVEDIVDTGLTMRHLLELLATRKPASIKVCTLLDKPARRKTDVEADYVGFEIPDEFVVGYGLDYAQYFRNLPYVAVLEEVPTLPE